MTPADFAQALLQRLGLPTTANNIAALVAFQAHEGGHMNNAAAYNPINTTLKLPGSHPVTKIGVQAYSSWEQGLEATAKTLAQGNMGAITAALARSASPDETLRAVASSPWGCTICANVAASSLQSYADKIFPVGKGMLDMGKGILDTGEHAIKELFQPKSHAGKIGMVVIGVTVAAGLGLLGYSLLKRK
jgi:hypothetical protein